MFSSSDLLTMAAGAATGVFLDRYTRDDKQPHYDLHTLVCAVTGATSAPALRKIVCTAAKQLSAHQLQKILTVAKRTLASIPPESGMRVLLSILIHSVD